MQAFEVKTKDGLTLKVTKWNDVDEGGKGTLIIIHGIGEHQGRYSHVVKHFIDHDYVVYTYDQRGHGKSDGKLGHTPDISFNLDDLQRIIDSSEGKKLYLYGHSFGGSVLVNYLLRKEEDSRLVAAVLSAPWIWLKKQPSKIDVALASVMNLFYPSFTQNNKIDTTALSTIDQVGIEYLNDPLVHPKISAGLFKSFYASGLYAIEKAGNLSIRTLVIHGEDDMIVDPNGSKEFCKNSALASLKLYSNTRHELHNDKRAEEVLGYVSDWLESQ